MPRQRIWGSQLRSDTCSTGQQQHQMVQNFHTDQCALLADATLWHSMPSILRPPCSPVFQLPQFSSFLSFPASPIFQLPRFSSLLSFPSSPDLCEAQVNLSTTRAFRPGGPGIITAQYVPYEQVLVTITACNPVFKWGLAHRVL